MPPSGIPAGIQGLDKAAHFFGYLVLGFLFAANQEKSRRQLLKILGWIGFYALLDEATQPLVGREFDLLDIAADLLGASVGAVAFLRSGLAK